MFDNLRRDVNHFLAGSFYQKEQPLTPSRALFVLLSKEFHLAASYRAANWLHRRGLTKAAIVLQRLALATIGSDVSYAASIGPGVCFVHGTDIVIGAEAVIGEDAVIFNGVTLGKRKGTDGGADGMPHVGARVLLATGSKLFGPISVGDDARVGANAVVLGDVPAGGTAVGAPARVVRVAGGGAETNAGPAARVLPLRDGEREAR